MMYARYENTRLSGQFNMITEANHAAEDAGLTSEEYWFVLNNYSELKMLNDAFQIHFEK